VISFSHIRDPRNTGDMASCPAQYFDFGPHEVLNYSEKPKGSVVIYGGGTMVNWLARKPVLPDVPKVIWGAGSSRHGETEPWPDPDGFALIGTREWTPERERAGLYAPCPSCMSPLFDLTYSVSRERVAFVNASESIRSRYPAAYKTGLPTMDNSATMTEIVAFLGSAETVVTNSYHGVYWAHLLGRKVEVHGYSSKFHRLAPHTLGEARDATVRFYERVMALVGGRVAA
jgi:hypothetical protein